MGSWKKSFCYFGTVVIFMFFVSNSYAYLCKFRDSRGVEIVLKNRPTCVVSVVPAITEIIFGLGAADTLCGITYHTTYPAAANSKKLVGGFFSPSVKVIQKIHPDVVFVSKFHTKLIKDLSSLNCILIELETNSILDSYKNILLLGKMFNREKQAKALVRQIKNQLKLIKRKVAKIPISDRKRVLRIMGRKSIMVPGDDSFQNEVIEAAGGIPPKFGKKGAVVPITKEEWMKFNPQVIYGCGGDRIVVEKFFHRPGWRDVDAVKDNKIFFFPCELTCRVATKTGYFVQWLSARIYSEYFSIKENQVIKDGVFKTRPIYLPLRYVKKSRIVYSHIRDFVHKTLIIDLKEPMMVVSTLEGQRKGITSVGNHYLPPPCWYLGHKQGLPALRKMVYRVIGKKEKQASFLFTGADMDNLVIKHARFRDMEVYALVTAGVKSNAVRMSADTGRFYEPGTINIIILPNMKLSPRAMTRAIISATEAKTAAVSDLDVRSSETPLINQATGTGTDNIIVVQGRGVLVDNSGGHSKMGELIAKTVYEGVQEAIAKQNGIVADRSIFSRLKDRKINIFELIASSNIPPEVPRNKLLAETEKILLEPDFASFVKSSLAISDAYQRGLIGDLKEYRRWCISVASEIAGYRIDNLKEFISLDYIPPVLKMSLNAVLNGAYLRIIK